MATEIRFEPTLFLLLGTSSGQVGWRLKELLRRAYGDIPILRFLWVDADATECAIEPGTLLTTADKPGYAMAVRDRDRAQGAILGKAMTRLEKGKTGMVLVLVNLQ